MEHGAPPRHPVNSVDHALQLLLLLRDEPDLRVTAAAERLGFSPSTAHRLLSTLEHRGFVTQDRMTRAYRVGPALIELGFSSTRSIDLREVSEPYLRAGRDPARRDRQPAREARRLGAFRRGIRGRSAHPHPRAHRDAAAGVRDVGRQGVARRTAEGDAAGPVPSRPPPLHAAHEDLHAARRRAGPRADARVRDQ